MPLDIPPPRGSRFGSPLVLPRPIDDAFHRQMHARVNGALGGRVINAESLPLSQGFYYGQIIGGHLVQIFKSEGHPIDTLHDLDAIACHDFVSKSRTKAANGSNGTKLDKASFLEQIRSGEHWYQPT